MRKNGDGSDSPMNLQMKFNTPKICFSNIQKVNFGFVARIWHSKDWKKERKKHDMNLMILFSISSKRKSGFYEFFYSNTCLYFYFLFREYYTLCSLEAMKISKTNRDATLPVRETMKRKWAQVLHAISMTRAQGSKTNLE